MKLNVRRRLVAGAVTAVPALIILGSFVAPAGSNASAFSVPASASATAASATPTPSCLDSPTPTALPGLPTPEPIPLCASPSAGPTLGPTPTPTVLPTQNASNPSPTPNHGGSGGGGSTGGGTSTGSSGTGVGGGPAPAQQPATSDSAFDPEAWPQSVSGHLVVADPLLALQVDQVLQHSVTQQRPDLLHFSLDANPISVLLNDLGTPGASAIGLTSPLPVLPGTAGALLLSGVLAGLVVLAVHAQWRRLSTVLVIAPAALAIPISAAAAVLISQPAPPPAVTTVATTDEAVQPAPPSLGALRAHAMVPGAVATWGRLVGIENSLTSQHDRIVSNEQEIAGLTVALRQPPSHLGGGQHGLRPTAFTMLSNRLRLLVGRHAALVAGYQRTLQGEYDFFVAAAQSPRQLSALQVAVKHTTPAVQKAVTYDINLVQTQLAQQAAINQAVAQSPAPVVPASVLRGPVTFHAPVGGVVSQPFGPTSFSLEPPVTYQGVFYPHFHTGLDIASSLDAPVGAAAAGVVILATSSKDAAGSLVGYGNYVVIRHANGLMTLYGHLDKLAVKAGQAVAQGQLIGLCGSTGWSTGPHVHFEIRLNGTWVDPAPFIANQIRH